MGPRRGATACFLDRKAGHWLRVRRPKIAIELLGYAEKVELGPEPMVTSAGPGAGLPEAHRAGEAGENLPLLKFEWAKFIDGEFFCYC